MKRRSFLRALRLGFIPGSFAALSAAYAADMQWPKTTVSATYNKKDLNQFLREFALTTGVQVQIDQEVRGNVTARYDKLPLRAVLEQVCAEFGLIWYFDGTVLYVNPAASAMSKILPLRDVKPTYVKRMLDQLNISDSRYTVAVDKASNTLKVAGHPRFVEMVEQAVRGAKPGDDSEDRAVLRVFRLKHTRAQDTRGPERQLIPGIATILTSLFPAGSGGTGYLNVNRLGLSEGETEVQVDQGPQRIQRMGNNKNVGYQSDGPQYAMPEETAFRSGARSSRGFFGGAGNSPASRFPQITADPSNNAIVIRDFPERMSQYEYVLSQLDLPSNMVELSVTIAEVSSDSMDKLGVDWSYESGKVSAVGRDPADETTASGVIARGAQLAGIVKNPAGLLLRLRAMAGTGKANLESKPMIVTMNNLEAMIDSKTSFYVPVAGNQDANLFEVNAGSRLKMLPSIVQGSASGPRSIRVTLAVEDGDVTDELVNKLPVVRRGSVNTSAVIREGESLVLAGFSSNREKMRTIGIPVLSELPIIGPIFRARETAYGKLEKLFIVSPRILNVETAQEGVNERTRTAAN